MSAYCPECPFARMVAANRAAQLARSRWSPNKIARLRILARGSLTGEQIGLDLGFSRSAIIAKCLRLGVPLPRKRAGGRVVGNAP